MFNEEKSLSEGDEVPKSKSQLPKPNPELPSEDKTTQPKSKLRWVLIILGILEIPLPAYFLFSIFPFLISLNKNLGVNSISQFIGIGFFTVLLLVALSQLMAGLLSLEARLGKMKTKLLIILGIILSLFAIPIIMFSVIYPVYNATSEVGETNTQSPTPTPTDVWKTVKNTVHNYSFSYPSDKYSLYKFDVNDYRIFDCENIEECGPKYAFDVKVFDNQQQLTPDNWMKNNQNSWYSTYKQCLINDSKTSVSNLTFLGQDAVELKVLINKHSQNEEICNVDFLNNGGESKHIVLSKNNAIYEISIFSDSKELYPELEQVLSTFKFTDQDSASDTSDWKTYKNEALGYSEEVPANSFSIKVPPDMDIDGPSASIYDSDDIDVGGIFAIKSCSQQDGCGGAWYFPEYRMNEKTININGVKATRFIYTGNVHGDAKPEVVIIDNGKYKLEFWLWEDNPPSSKELFDQILSTFKFTE